MFHDKEECKGCNIKSTYKCNTSSEPLYTITFSRRVRMATENGREYVFSKCPCGTCLVKSMCNEKCLALRKHESQPDSITIYSGL